ncbi:phage portal protein [Paenibacillus sp. 79R4]|uniref:XkdQ/YqbQ family protein n=1 Tax=Paenibacillus sp. 79R4 TaxID=2212847 RepID=UPI0015BB566B|nr:phage portal protein [Paenibacillus sp. 79R4]NWL89561.1 phage portal protein [Paenibacillus sp. 79R4]
MSYEVVYKDKYYLRELIESISLKDSLDQISYQADIRLKVTSDFPDLQPGQPIRVSGIPFGKSGMVYLLNPGVVWDCDSTNRETKHMTVTVYDRTIYLAKSEDEYLLPAGQTASQRLKKYASDWGIKLSTVPDTKTKLKKAVYRARPIYNMLNADLQETVKSGGDMYIPRMTPGGLELFKVGSNKDVYVLEAIEETTQSRTLDGTITKVKVIGTEDRKEKKKSKKKGSSGNVEIPEGMTLEEIGRLYGGKVDKKSKKKGKKPKVKADSKVELPSKILAITTGQTDKFGTLQRMVQDEDVKTAAAAKKLGESMLSGVQETFTVSGPDLNIIRAGDAVIYNKMNLIVTSVIHDLGEPGHMSLNLASQDYVRRRYFLNYG